jgi:DNA-binding transcriptional LysR family regulator
MPWDDRLGRRIKLRALAILQETVAAGSMAKAARALAMTQPAVSYAIAELEQALGVALLDRTPQGVTATVYGEALVRRGAVMINELRQGVDDIAFLADPSAGEIRIGTTPPMSALAAAAINRLAPRHPSMAFHLMVEHTDALLRELHRRGIELVVSRMIEPAAPEGFSAEILFHDRLIVIAGRHNPWTRRRRVALADLMQDPWALPPAEGFLGPLIRAAFSTCGLDAPRPAVITASTYTLAMLAAEGPFLFIHPATMLRVPPGHPQLAAVPVELPGGHNPIGLLRLRDRTSGPVAAVFAAALREVIHEADLGRPPPSRRTSNQADGIRHGVLSRASAK